MNSTPQLRQQLNAATEAAPFLPIEAAASILWDGDAGE
jgi:hypothetical protein